MSDGSRVIEGEALADEFSAVMSGVGEALVPEGPLQLIARQPASEPPPAVPPRLLDERGAQPTIEVSRRSGVASHGVICQRADRPHEAKAAATTGPLRA